MITDYIYLAWTVFGFARIKGQLRASDSKRIYQSPKYRVLLFNVHKLWFKTCYRVPQLGPFSYFPGRVIRPRARNLNGRVMAMNFSKHINLEDWFQFKGC